MRTPARLFSWLLLFAFLFVRKFAWAQEQDTGVVAGIEEPPKASDAEANPEKLFRDVRIGARARPKFGNAEAVLDSQFGGPLLRIPLLDQGVRPEDAEFKLGRFYLDVRSVSGSLLYSDNVNLQSENREDGFIGITRLRMAALFQLNDNLRLSVAGTLVYLPFENKIGIAGFGVEDILAQFENRTLAHAQITYDLNMGEWHTELYDDFRVRLGQFGESEELFDGSTFDEEDRAGRYTFRDTTQTRHSRLGDSFIESRNIVGFSTDRLLPTETRLEFGANRSDFWYQGERGGFLPSSRELAYVSLSSERENLRFKPYADYRTFRYSDDPFSQQAVIGFQGPITENLEILGEVGYFESGRSDQGTHIWRARLGHTISPLAYHELGYVRRVTQPDQDIEDSLSYLLRRSLGPTAQAEVYAIASRFDDIDDNRSSSDEFRAGTRFSFLVAEGTILRLSGSYSKIEYEDNIYGDRERWIAQVGVRRNSLEGRFFYRYENVSETPTRNHYYENLFGLTVTKYF